MFVLWSERHKKGNGIRIVKQCVKITGKFCLKWLGRGYAEKESDGHPRHESAKHWYWKRREALVKWWTCLPACLIWVPGIKPPLLTWCLENKQKMETEVLPWLVLWVSHTDTRPRSLLRQPRVHGRRKGGWSREKPTRLDLGCTSYFLSRFRRLHGAQYLAPGNLSVSPTGSSKGLLFSLLALPCMQELDLCVIL